MPARARNCGTRARPLARWNDSGARIACLADPSSRRTMPLRGIVLRLSEPHVLPVERLAVDALGRRRDPARDLAARGARDHQRLHELAIRGGRQPVADAALPGGLVDLLPQRIEARLGEHADAAVEAPVGEGEAELDPGLLADAVEVLDALLVVGDVLVTQHLVHGVAQRDVLLLELALLEHLHRVAARE